ncbi:MAG: hypothetical protein WC477_01990 [Patescibacteria group bacterium]
MPVTALREYARDHQLDQDQSRSNQPEPYHQLIARLAKYNALTHPTRWNVATLTRGEFTYLAEADLGNYHVLVESIERDSVYFRFELSKDSQPLLTIECPSKTRMGNMPWQVAVTKKAIQSFDLRRSCFGLWKTLFAIASPNPRDSQCPLDSIPVEERFDPESSFVLNFLLTLLDRLNAQLKK